MTSENQKNPTGGDVESAGPAAVTVTKAPETDWTEFNARLEQQRAEARERLKAERAALLAVLREMGVDEIEASYDGYADSGNVQGFTVTPDSVQLAELEPRLADFVWGLAYNLHPGFEINDGGAGTLTWDVPNDRIDLDHADFYTARNEYLHEDI